jgi:RNA polymerase sigma-70 factor (ECF subfamily)
MAATDPKHSGKPNQDLPDEVLFDRYRKGDLSCLRTLIDRYRDELYRFLVRLVGDRTAAEDVFQDTFLQIHLSSATFDIERRFRPWLFTIAANKGRDHLRRKGRRQTLDLSAPVGGAGSDDGLTYVDLLKIDMPGPDHRLDSVERDAKVQQVLETMPPLLKEILLLAYFQRLSYANIAEDLGIPLGTVKSRLHAAVASFAQGWSRLETNPDGRRSKG